jgi:hypothetical protein
MCVTCRSTYIFKEAMQLQTTQDQQHPAIRLQLTRPLLSTSSEVQGLAGECKYHKGQHQQTLKQEGSPPAHGGANQAAIDVPCAQRVSTHTAQQQLRVTGREQV